MDYVTKMNIVELLKDIDEALSSISEESMDEKIMTKKQAARKRALRAKRRAEKKAAEQEQQKAQEQSVAEPEQPEQNNVEDKGEKKPFESLIVYDPKMAMADNTPTDYSEAFKEFMKHINAIIEKYSPLWAKAEEIWKQQVLKMFHLKCKNY